MSIPALTVKITFMFDMNARGWSESWWVSGLSSKLSDYVPYANAVATKRRLLMASIARLHAVRISFETNAQGNPQRGDSILEYLDWTGNTGAVGTDPDLAALIVWRTADGLRKKHQYLRGIPDGVQNPNGLYNPGYPGWTTNLNAYYSTLLGGLAQVVNPGAGWVGFAVVYQDIIDDYVVNANNQISLSLNTGVVFKPPGPVNDLRQMVRITGLNGKSTLNGQLLVYPVSSTEWNTVRSIGVSPYKSPGVISFYDGFYYPTVNLAVQKIVSRKTGLPFLLPRGRARPRVRS